MSNHPENCNCNICQPLAPDAPPPPLQAFDPFNPAFDPSLIVSQPTAPADLTPPAAKGIAEVALSQLPEINGWDPYDPYNNYPGNPTLCYMLDKLEKELPMPEDLLTRFKAARPEIILLETGLPPEQGCESTDYTPETLYQSIDTATGGGGGGGGGIPFSEYFTPDVFDGFFFLIFLDLPCIDVLTLFDEVIAEISVLVQLPLSLLVQLLACLLPLLFLGVFLLNLKLPSFSLVIGFGISLSLGAILAVINLALFYALNLAFSINLSAFANVSVQASLSAAIGPAATPALENGTPVESTNMVDAAGNPAPPTGMKACPAAIEMMQNTPGALSEIGNFGESFIAPSPQETALKPYDTETKMNVITPEGQPYSRLGYAVVNQKPPLTKPKSLREVINRLKAEEAAVLYLFDWLNMKYNMKITLAELILRASGFKDNTPIDAMLLPILEMNLPSKVTLHTSYIMQGISDTEVPCAILTLNA